MMSWVSLASGSHPPRRTPRRYAGAPLARSSTHCPLDRMATPSMATMRSPTCNNPCRAAIPCGAIRRTLASSTSRPSAPSPREIVISTNSPPSERAVGAVDDEAARRAGVGVDGEARRAAARARHHARARRLVRRAERRRHRAHLGVRRRDQVEPRHEADLLGLALAAERARAPASGAGSDSSTSTITKSPCSHRELDVRRRRKVAEHVRREGVHAAVVHRRRRRRRLRRRSRRGLRRRRRLGGLRAPRAVDAPPVRPRRTAGPSTRRRPTRRRGGRPRPSTPASAPAPPRACSAAPVPARVLARRGPPPSAAAAAPPPPRRGAAGVRRISRSAIAGLGLEKRRRPPSHQCRRWSRPAAAVLCSMNNPCLGGPQSH